MCYRTHFRIGKIMKLLSCVFLLLQMYEICKCRLCSTSHVAYKTCKTEPTINKRIFNKLNLKPAEPNPDSYRFFFCLFFYICANWLKKKKLIYESICVPHWRVLWIFADHVTVHLVHMFVLWTWSLPSSIKPYKCFKISIYRYNLYNINVGQKKCSYVTI